MERFEKKLKSYEVTETKFITWLTYTLRSSYINFVKKYKFDKEQEIFEISLDKFFFINDKGVSLYELLAASNTDMKNETLELIERLNEYLEKNYSNLDALLFRVYNLEVFYSLIPYAVMEYFNMTHRQAFNFLQEARATYFNKYQTFDKMQDKIASITAKIISLEKNNAKYEEIQKLKDKKHKYLLRLRQLRVLVPYDYLADKFDISKSKIIKIIAKIRKDILSNFL